MTATIDQLKTIFESELSDDALQIFLDSAIELVNSNVTSTSISAAQKDNITLFVAAHFAHSAAPRVKSERIGSEYNYTVQGETGTDWKATYYGQTALALDTSGALVKLGKKQGTFRVLS